MHNKKYFFALVLLILNFDSFSGAWKFEVVDPENIYRNPHPLPRVPQPFLRAERRRMVNNRRYSSGDVYVLPSRTILFSRSGVLTRVSLNWGERSDLTNDHLRNTLESNPNIRHLNLFGIQRVTDFSPIARLQNLNSLDVRHTNITCQVLIDIIVNNPGLRELNIQQCPSLTENPGAPNPQLSRLEELLRGIQGVIR